jgi:hypothetical protein
LTTIAFDGETLAADRMVTVRGLKYPGEKLYHSPAGWAMAYAFDGARALRGITALRNMSFADLIAGTYEDLAEGEREGASIIAINHSGEGYYLADKVFTPIPNKIVTPSGAVVFACGSGCHVAIGAMMAGASAIKAVDIACSVHADSGFGVDSIRVSELSAL